MSNNISLTTIQNNGSIVVSGDIAATGYYSLTEGNVIKSFSATVTDLVSFAASLDTTGAPAVTTQQLNPTSPETAGDLMDAAVAIKGLIEGAFAVDVPVISGDELFGSSAEVAISIPTRATVYYTTDGSTPTSDSTAYTEPFTVTGTTTVKAVALKDGVYSEVASKTLTKLASPTISGTTPFSDTTSVTMTGPEGASIYYTTDGSTPTSGSTAYSGAITLSATTTVKAVAVKSGVTSAASSKKFTKE